MPSVTAVCRRSTAAPPLGTSVSRGRTTGLAVSTPGMRRLLMAGELAVALPAAEEPPFFNGAFQLWRFPPRPPPKGGSCVLGLEVRDRALDATVRVRRSRRD